ncbi:MAG: 23S rRNA (uracil(1939)-C(5))-methyltransferase RlmD [Terracidiphilus sp.]|jgi:23S rRNA (uracil1939-C5)-methyltransferase
MKLREPQSAAVSRPFRKKRGKDGAPSQQSGAVSHPSRKDKSAARVGHPSLPPTEPHLVEIEKPIYGGAFLARLEGKAVFVPLTLPGEKARVRITEDKRGYATAEAEGIVAASANRIAPACPHFGACGGCHYQHAKYEAQLAFKQTILRETLERGGVAAPAEIGMLDGEPWRYRNRIRVAFDASGNPGYRGRRSHAVIPVSECPIAAPLLVNTAKAAAEAVRQLAPALRPAGIELFCDASETAVLASVFVSNAAQLSPAKMGADFDDFAQAVSVRIPALKGAELVAEGRAGDRVHARSPHAVAQWGAASLTYRAAGFDYRVDHGAFFQVNRFLVDGLVDLVAANRKGELAWDLFAGVGLFARRLTASFARVVTVESEPAATQALSANLKGTTGTAVRSTTLDFLRGTRKGQRPDLIVVDPPRAGLGPEITALLAEIAAPVLVYVSCDPATLARDLRALILSGYAIESITLADLFPQTFHLETVVQLRRS